jgi:hypothetical protein
MKFARVESQARCMSSDSPDSNKRRAPRQRTLKGGKIVFKEGAFTFECMIKNISATGALLQVENTNGIPNRFTLVFEDRSPSRLCNVAWRSANRLGVAFEDAPGS